MKIKYCLVWMGIVLSAITVGCSSSMGLTKEEKATKAAALHVAIEKRTFIVEVDKALPMGGSARVLTSPYSLELNEEKVKSYLPYFGRAYSLPYGGGEGLIFDSVMTDYQSSFDKKGKTLIEFKTQSKEDQFVYRIHISPNGTASIDVTPMNRQPISFTGNAFPKIDK